MLIVRQPLFATLRRSIGEVVMAHERELDLLQTLQADPQQVDQRWPVPYAIAVIIVVSASLWALILAAASWLIG
jgi:hypothetical protein